MDNQISRVSKIDLCQIHQPLCIHLVVCNLFIVEPRAIATDHMPTEWMEHAEYDNEDETFTDVKI